MQQLDSILAVCLPVLAAWILLSGLDDLFVDLVWLLGFRSRPAVHAAATPRPIAIFVPLWHEHRVIANMLEHNLAAIRYPDYTWFVGVYPNDEATIRSVEEVAAHQPNIQLAMCPHDGPTSKADCLNWIYQRMLLYEQRQGVRFEIVVLHDAEDIIHPEELQIINGHLPAHDGMVQVPVLPLRTPLYHLTHGVYCDEFAEYQTRDMPARVRSGAFLPSCGVGTGYARSALESLTASGDNRIFDPASLTEDYDSGLRLHRLGCPQVYVPVRLSGGQPVATREFFPGRLRQALRQRTRWVTGNALQAWDRHGWRGGLRQAYWFWRDRKGLVGNPVSAVANLILFYGGATWLWSWHSGARWGLGAAVGWSFVPAVLWMTLALQIHRLVIRMWCVGRIYGWVFAAAVPVRVPWANWINAACTARALWQYVNARLHRRPLVWLKTDHAYPSLASLAPHRRLLGEILVRSRLLDARQLQTALSLQRPGVRLGECLIQRRWLAEEQLYSALSAQQNVPFEHLEAEAIDPWIARALPGAVMREHRLLPFRVSPGRLHVAGPELPSDEVQTTLRRCTALEIRFHYVTPANFEELMERFLGRSAGAG